MGKNKDRKFESNLLDRAPVAEEGYNVESEAPATEAAVEEPTEVSEPAVEAVAPEVVEEPQPAKAEEPEKNYGIREETTPRSYGVVNSKCARLNIREEANTDAKKLAVVNSGTRLRIDKSKSTNDFFRVMLDSGISGFAAKEFIDEV